MKYSSLPALFFHMMSVHEGWGYLIWPSFFSCNPACWKKTTARRLETPIRRLILSTSPVLANVLQSYDNNPLKSGLQWTLFSIILHQPMPARNYSVLYYLPCSTHASVPCETCEQCSPALLPPSPILPIPDASSCHGARRDLLLTPSSFSLASTCPTSPCVGQPGSSPATLPQHFTLLSNRPEATELALLSYPPS